MEVLVVGVVAGRTWTCVCSVFFNLLFMCVLLCNTHSAGGPLQISVSSKVAANVDFTYTSSEVCVAGHSTGVTIAENDSVAKLHAEFDQINLAPFRSKTIHGTTEK